MEKNRCGLIELRLQVISFLLLIINIMVPPQILQAQSGASTISLKELKKHMSILASDSLGGRRPDDEGYNKAARYASEIFNAAGIRRIFKDSMGNDTYFQTVPLIKTRIIVDKPITLISSKGEYTLQSFEDFILREKGPSLPPVPVVFIGYGISEPKFGWNDFEGIDVKGKAVVLLMGAPMRDRKPVLPDSVHSSYQSFPGIRKKVMSNSIFRQNMPAAVFVIADSEHVAQWDQFPNALNEPRIIALPDDRSIKIPTGPALYGIMKGSFVKKLFENQLYHPTSEAENGQSRYTSFDLADVKISFDFRIIGEVFESMNIVGMIPGTDPAVSNEYITLSAHLDHVNPVNGLVLNGADDNASGSIGVLEVGKAIASHPPRRPVMLCLFTGEESGFLGSKYFVSHSPVPMNNITVNINLDMIGRSDAKAEKNRKHYVIGSEKTNPGLRRLIDSVNNATVCWPLDYESEERTFQGSDHISFHKHGIPVAFFYSGQHQDLHTPTDDAEKIDYEKMQKLTQLVYTITSELGNRMVPMRPVLMNESNMSK